MKHKFIEGKNIQYIFGDDKLYTEKQMKLYAERCMLELLTTYPNGENDMGEISSHNLRRIRMILNN